MYSFCGDYRLNYTVKRIVPTTIIFIQNKSIDFHEIGKMSSCDSNNYIYLISAENIPCKSNHTLPQYVSNLRFPLVSLRTITASSEIPRHGAVNLSLPHKESASSNPECSREGRERGLKGRTRAGTRHTQKRSPYGQTKCIESGVKQQR